MVMTQFPKWTSERRAFCSVRPLWLILRNPQTNALDPTHQLLSNDTDPTLFRSYIYIHTERTTQTYFYGAATMHYLPFDSPF